MTQSSRWLRPRRLPGRIGPIGVVRLVLVHMVIAVAIVAAANGLVAGLIGGTLAAVLLALLLGRYNGRWLTDTIVLWARYRRRAGRGAPTPDPRLAALRYLSPTLTVQNVAGPDGPLGVADDGTGWFAVLELRKPHGDNATTAPVPITRLMVIADDAEVAGVQFQVVTQTTGGVPVAWVAVRVDARQLAESFVGTPEYTVNVPAVMAEMVRRVGRALARRGVAARTLDADRLLAALAHSCDLAPGGQPAAEERWREWRSRRLAHTCFWVRSWPDPRRAGELFAAIRAMSLPSTSIGITVAPRGKEADLRCVVRIATPHAGNEDATTQLLRVSRGYGAEMFRLDGEHALGVYASAPTGGGMA